MTINDYMITMARLIGCRFHLFGKEVSANKVFADDGLLAAFAKRAETLSTFVLKKPLGLTFKKGTGGLSSLRVTFDESIPNSYRVLCMLDVLVELIHSCPSTKEIKLDELLYD